MSIPRRGTHDTGHERVGRRVSGHADEVSEERAARDTWACRVECRVWHVRQEAEAPERIQRLREPLRASRVSWNVFHDARTATVLTLTEPSRTPKD